MRNAEIKLNSNGTLKLIPIDASDDGIDLAWIELPDEQRWQSIQDLITLALEFPNARGLRFAKTVDRTHFFEDLPRSRVSRLRYCIPMTKSSINGRVIGIRTNRMLKTS
jgi:hypothetical protein